MVYVGFQSDKGKNRSNNEDACFVLPKENVYVVADGVGGNNAGELASKTAVTQVAEYIKKNPILGLSDYNQLADYFKELVQLVNETIMELASTSSENVGMATTLIVCYIYEDKAFFANVGDSRAYLHRKGELFQLTEDHTYVNSLIKMGAITPEEAKDHQRSHVITRAMGADKGTEADYYVTDVEGDDVIILCTDGLYGEVSEEKISQMIDKEKDMSLLAKAFVAEANKAGGRDNITVVCLKVTGGVINEQ